MEIVQFTAAGRFREGDKYLKFELADRISKMTASEFATRSALQIFLERPRFGLVFERHSGFNSPWPMFGSVRTGALVVFEQSLFEIVCNASVVNRLVCLAYKDRNVNEIFHLVGLP